MNQLNHYNTKFKQRNFPITLICENVNNAPNIGSLFRIADAFGVEKLIFCGSHVPIGRKMTKTSRATEKVVNYKLSDNALDVIKTHKEKGYQILSLEITDGSEPLHSHKFLFNEPLVLVVGDENFGISEAILNISDTIVHIEMFGQNSSMNVVQATNIALYEITKQLM